MKRIVTILLTFYLGCSEKDEAPFLKNGTYTYAGFNTNYLLVASGILDLQTADTIITGTRSISQTGDSLALEAGTGVVSGYIFPSSHPSNRINIVLVHINNGDFFIDGYKFGDTIYGSRVFFPDTVTEVEGNSGSFKLWYND